VLELIGQGWGLESELEVVSFFTRKNRSDTVSCRTGWHPSNVTALNLASTVNRRDSSRLLQFCIEIHKMSDIKITYTSHAGPKTTAMISGAA